MAFSAAVWLIAFGLMVMPPEFYYTALAGIAIAPLAGLTGHACANLTKQRERGIGEIVAAAIVIIAAWNAVRFKPETISKFWDVFGNAG